MIVLYTLITAGWRPRSALVHASIYRAGSGCREVGGRKCGE